MTNLLLETFKILKENKKKEQDIEWVGTEKQSITWEEFRDRANRMYDNGYGCEEVNPDLLVVGKDFWLERHKYDGSEWWEFKAMPIKPKKGNINIFLHEVAYE